MAQVLRVEITTADCAEGTAYIHDLPVDTMKTDIILAIETLYGNSDVLDIHMYLSDTEG